MHTTNTDNLVGLKWIALLSLEFITKHVIFQWNYNKKSEVIYSVIITIIKLVTVTVVNQFMNVPINNQWIEWTNEWMNTYQYVWMKNIIYTIY